MPGPPSSALTSANQLLLLQSNYTGKGRGSLCLLLYAGYIIIVGRTEMKTRPNSNGGIPEDLIDSFAQDMVQRMSPLQRGKLLYPHARPVAFKDLPQSVLSDHLNRYTSEELRDGQFFEVLPGRFTFIMGNTAHNRRNSLKRKRFHKN